MEKKHVKIPDGTSRFACIVRHAERDPIQVMVDALVPRLTKKGESDAYLLGQNVAHLAPFTLFHSPVPRCQQTAECIAQGIMNEDKSAVIAGPLVDLGGPYITGNWDGVVASIERLGHDAFIRKWFDNELPQDLIMPLKDAAVIQLRILTDQLLHCPTSSINVTHDWNIMIIREHYFGLRHEDIGDPGFLDGVCAYTQGDSLHLAYHDHVRTVPIPPAL